MKVLCCGVGEYTTGYIPGSTAAPDKSKGVVGIVLFDLKRRGKIESIGMVGVNGTKIPDIKNHLDNSIGKCYKDMDTTIDAWPKDNIIDPFAYREAIDSLNPKDAVIIFTPDDTHYDIAMYAIKKGLHVLLTKPAVKTIQHHIELEMEASKNGVLVQIEFHKRWDPIYSDARERMRALGDFSYFWSYMSQPRRQLNTFKSWAGKSSDISYYLNSHHMDLHCWAMEGRGRPLKVATSKGTGVAESKEFGCPKGTEDVITLLVEWEHFESKNKATAVYTSAWTAPDNGEVHTQQKFLCLTHQGEVRADQAHRGYEITCDGKYNSVNPLYMRYVPDGRGYFAGQKGYGYLSIEAFIDACNNINSGASTVEEEGRHLPVLSNTRAVTAMLEAGRQSLDLGGAWVDINV